MSVEHRWPAAHGPRTLTEQKPRKCVDRFRYNMRGAQMFVTRFTTIVEFPGLPGAKPRGEGGRGAPAAEGALRGGVRGRSGAFGEAPS